jgi:predicted RNA binding protein YcfA (HicA-like mRNA interferase family)
MTKKEKLWQKANNSPENLTFDEFETLLIQNGWEFSRQKGSHRLWYSPSGKPLPIQPRKDGKAKLYQIQQFFEYQEGNQ